MREKIQERRMMRLARAVLALALLAPAAARASFLSGEALDTAANVLSWVVLVVVPIVAIGLFGYVHVLPELIAEKRQHPQKHAIKTLCILSLFFGGLLWPLAWLWAYTRPVGFRAAYGSEKHEDYYVEMGEKARLGQLVRADIIRLRHELAAMQEKGDLPHALVEVRDAIEELAARHAIEHEAQSASVADRADKATALEGGAR
jgi:CBS domain containing-hemolysin-like protein